MYPRGLSRFTARVSKSVDAVISIDEHVVKKLEATADRQNQPPSRAQAVFHALNPLSPFQSEKFLSEDDLKSVFLRTTTRIVTEIHPLSREAFELHDQLEIIQANLDQIQQLAVDEVGDLPRMDVLAALWTQLARADDYAQYKSHKDLLADLTQFYKDASDVMKQTISALHIAEAELDAFRDEYATPGLVLKDDPLDMIISQLRGSIKRLGHGRRVMDGMEIGAQ